jgi:hypothetical protein
MTLAVSTLQKEGVYQASKWLKFQVLCDLEELSSLFSLLSSFWIFPLTGIVSGAPVLHTRFLEEYGGWIEGLKKGLIPSDAELRRLLACAWVDGLENLWLQEIPGKGYLVKIAQPTVQVQAHYFTYSSADGVFRPMSMGPESIFWGLQFSYPQVYQDPKTLELKKAPENRIFEILRSWVRNATRATPFSIAGQRINSPIRIGKRCMSWIAQHPQLLDRNIGIWSADAT